MRETTTKTTTDLRVGDVITVVSVPVPLEITRIYTPHNGFKQVTTADGVNRDFPENFEHITDKQKQ